MSFFTNRAALVAAGIFLSAFGLRADLIIFDDTTTTQGTPILATTSTAASFTSDAAGGQLTGLVLGLNGNPGKTAPQNETVALYADNADAPSNLITDLSIVPDTTFNGSLYTVNLSSTPILDPSTRYWIEISGASNLVGWQTGTDNGTGVDGESYIWGGSFFANSAGEPLIMQVSESGDSAAPEPASFALLIGGAALIVAKRRLTS